VFLGTELGEGFGDAVASLSVAALVVNVGAKEIVLHYVVTMRVAQDPASTVAHDDLVAAGILRFEPLDGEEDFVVLDPRAEGAGAFIVVPFLHEEHAGLGAGVGLEADGDWVNVKRPCIFAIRE